MTPPLSPPRRSDCWTSRACASAWPPAAAPAPPRSSTSARWPGAAWRFTKAFVSEAEPPQRLAVYGFVKAAAGSLASANDLLLRELLRRGCAIDFYGIAGFADPGTLVDEPNFRFFPV